MVTGRSSKADRVYLDLKQAVIGGALAPGAPIDKDELCERFNASRSPVTIAINRLAYERLVLVEPQRGSFVAPIHLDEILQLMMVRRALEVEAAAEAARLGQGQLWTVLDSNLVYQEAALRVSDYPRFFQLDVEFHSAIVAASGWPKFNEVLDGAHSHLDRARRLVMPIPGHLEATLSEHHAILGALKKASPSGAASEMRRHIDRVAKQFESFSKEHPDLFAIAPMRANGRYVEKR